MEDNKQERFPIVDEEGRVVGAATRGECHNGSRLLHPVVHLHVFNSQGEVSASPISRQNASGNMFLTAAASASWST